VAGWRLEAPVEGFEGWESWDKDTGPDASSAPHTHPPHTHPTQTPRKHARSDAYFMHSAKQETRVRATPSSGGVTAGQSGNSRTLTPQSASHTHPSQPTSERSHAMRNSTRLLNARPTCHGRNSVRPCPPRSPLPESEAKGPATSHTHTSAAAVVAMALPLEHKHDDAAATAARAAGLPGGARAGDGPGDRAGDCMHTPRTGQTPTGTQENCAVKSRKFSDICLFLSTHALPERRDTQYRRHKVQHIEITKASQNHSPCTGDWTNADRDTRELRCEIEKVLLFVCLHTRHS
jgi:hypothetical protein